MLTQIIVEQEQKGQNLLPISFLRQLIGFYGDNMQFLVPGYLEQAMIAFARNQEQMRSNLRATFGMFPFGQFEEIGKQNMAMFERALRMLSPYRRTARRAGRGGAPSTPPEKRPSRRSRRRTRGCAGSKRRSRRCGCSSKRSAAAATKAERLRHPAPASRCGRRMHRNARAPISSGMTIFLTILLVLAMLATLGVLGMGVLKMIRGGDPRRSNKLMQSRVAFQGLALLLLALLMMLVGRRLIAADGAADPDLHARRRSRRDLARRRQPGPKQALRVEAYGTVDEANAAIGLARLHWPIPTADAMLARIQNDLFDLGADLCTPEDGQPRGRGAAHRRGAGRAPGTRDRRDERRAAAARTRSSCRAALRPRRICIWRAP